MNASNLLCFNLLKFYLFFLIISFQDNFIKTIVHLKACVFLNQTAWWTPVNLADYASNKATVLKIKSVLLRSGLSKSVCFIIEKVLVKLYASNYNLISLQILNAFKKQSTLPWSLHVGQSECVTNPSEPHPFSV